MAVTDSPTSVMTSTITEEERVLEISLRPRSLAEFVGQETLKQSLGVFMRAARQRGDSMEHVLLAGPPGLGKTSLAHIIARELGTNLKVTTGPALSKVADLAGILTSLQPRDVLFIDEIHRLQRTVEEVLYPAMEDFALDLVVGQGPGARMLRLDLPPFTLVGATTRVGMLGSPLRDRFGMTYRLSFYERPEMAEILARSAALLQLTIDDTSLQTIAGRSRATPRVGNRLLKRVRDYAQVHRQETVTDSVVDATLELLGVDELGLEITDRKVLVAMTEHFEGGPVGLQTLAAVTAEEEHTLEEVVEPFLLQRGLIQRTPRGRVVTEAGRRHLGKLEEQGKLI